MAKKFFSLLLLLLLAQTTFSQDKLIDILKEELNRNFEKLKTEPTPAYYMSYRVQDITSHYLGVSFGELVGNYPSHNRYFNTDVRVGSYEMDNTREIKGGSGNNLFSGQNPLALDDSPDAIKRALWENTDKTYKDAVRRYDNVKANVAVKVAAEDKSDDFTKETPEQYIEKPIPFKDLKFNEAEWIKKLKKYGNAMSENKIIYQGRATLQVEFVRKYFVNTEGTAVAENTHAFRMHINASTVAEDGMQLPLYKSYFATEIKELPSDEQVLKDIKEMSDMINQLRKAPVAETYSGPALMTAEAAGVFFHEIFGHRVEGARMKLESDAQTFKKKLGEPVLPNDITIFFDPKLKKYKGIPLNGSYVFDDEGVRGQRVDVVKDGLLKSFLMSRTPIEGFDHSNGHGRAVIYMDNVTRQSNMIIESSKPKSNKELRQMMIEQLKKDNKEYGYIFDLVSGGFTQVSRYDANAFNVTPLIVYRIYADGRPDELVRGVDMIGTPLSIFSQVTACGDDHGAFNGACGAESGSLPVSCVAPTLFIKIIETQKKAKSSSQPPILERP
ncbi:MAG: TldD/PmbA family protein [Tannerella sp.]|jgi:predicted Zn-dependent protease|nr:TldD/PmbA family protein [Tannerella sp.]